LLVLWRLTIPDPLRPPFGRICKLGVAGSSPARSIVKNGLTKPFAGVAPEIVLLRALAERPSRRPQPPRAGARATRRAGRLRTCRCEQRQRRTGCASPSDRWKKRVHSLRSRWLSQANVLDDFSTIVLMIVCASAAAAIVAGSESGGAGLSSSTVRGLTVRSTPRAQSDTQAGTGVAPRRPRRSPPP
jgi:hypothetical protein